MNNLSTVPLAKRRVPPGGFDPNLTSGSKLGCSLRCLLGGVKKNGTDTHMVLIRTVSNDCDPPVKF